MLRVQWKQFCLVAVGRGCESTRYGEGGVMGAPCLKREGYGSTMCEEGGVMGAPCVKEGGIMGAPCVKERGLWEHHV